MTGYIYKGVKCNFFVTGNVSVLLGFFTRGYKVTQVTRNIWEQGDRPVESKIFYRRNFVTVQEIVLGQCAVITGLFLLKMSGYTWLQSYIF